ncbi:SWI/SNF-related matrix-associated actin-dependent regulator of chromatin subfamily A containing DEAD/H box 1-like [Glandiceps talaboti]
MSLFNKFRYQKRSPPATMKKTSDVTEKDEDDIDGLPSTPPLSGADIGVIPETPSSERPSPVFGKSSSQKYKRTVKLKDNSSSEDEEEKKPLSSVTKKVKIDANSIKKASKSSKSTFQLVSSQSESDSSGEDVDKTPSRPCSSTSGYCSNNECLNTTTNQYREEELQRLLEIFLDRDKEELQEALKSTASMDEAIEKLLATKPKKFRPKRVRSPSPEPSFDTEYSSGSIQPAKKRTRREPSALRDSFTDSDATLINTQNKDQLLEELQERFPKQDLNDLERILENSDWCVERATNTLRSFEDSDNVVEINSDDGKADEMSKRENIAKQTKKPDKKKTTTTTTTTTSNKNSKSKTNDKDVYRRRQPIVISSDEDDSDDSHDNKSDDVQEVEEQSYQGSIDGNSNDGSSKDGKDEDGDDGCDGNEDEDVYSSDESYEEEMSANSKVLILSFFNDSTVEELQTVPGCSKKKATRIRELRPYRTWQDLYDKFDRTRLLTTDIIWDSKTILEEREMLRKLMNKCNKISTALQSIISQSLNDDDCGEDNEGHLVKQPQLLNASYSLKPYQMIGLNWLVLLHRKEVNGILADEMGLGKTIQAIAFLAHLLETGDNGPYLIVVPSSTMDNWIRELHKWCPALEILQYFGSQDDRRDLRASILSRHVDFNVIVSTYNMCMNTPEDRGLFKKIHLRYIILDEAHMLKNMNSQRYRNLMKIKADRRLLLTGTPLQNNLLELMSLLCFLMPQIFLVDGSTAHLKRIFTSVNSSHDENEKSHFQRDQIANAKRIMQPFVLRRIKIDVLKQLPKKHDRVEKCSLSDSQQEQYNNLIIKLSSSLRGSSDAGKLAGAMMQLRKMANHTLLHRHHYNDDKLKKMSKLMLKEPSHCDANAHLIFEDMSVMSDFELHNLCNMYCHLKRHVLPKSVLLNSGKFLMLDKLLPDMKKRGDRVLLFSQFTMMLDIVEVYMQSNKYKYLRLDGRTPVSERLELIDKYNNDDSIFVFLLSTKAGGLGINLTAANQVILHDIDFNPYNDKQAEDRCHRVGQTRDVTVVKLVSKNTIEEAILRCAMGKLRLERDMTTNNTDDDDSATDMATLLREALDL